MGADSFVEDFPSSGQAGFAMIDTSSHSIPERLLEAFQAHWANYRMSKAMPLLDDLASHPRTTPAQLLIAAKQIHPTGRFAKAADLVALASAMAPDDADIAVMHAELLERLGRTDDASERIQAVLDARPDHARAGRLAGHLERRAGNMESAADILLRHLHDHPSEDDWRVQYELAAVLDRLGDPAGAIKALFSAKQALAPRTAVFRQQWRAISARQWELTRMLDRNRLRRWQTAGTEDHSHPRICLMAGFPRSGTTLLERIITRHVDCVGTDESGILATQFRDPIVLAAASTDEAMAEIDDFHAEDLAAGRQEYFRATEEYLGEGLADRILIEKDPLLTSDLPLPLRLFPQARILMPLRDPRDVIVSFFFTIVPLNWNSAASGSLADSVRYYQETMRHWLHLRSRLDPDSWQESRYENLLGHPDQECRRLTTFLGIAHDPEMPLNSGNDLSRSSSTPSYDDVSKPLYTRSCGRWQHYEPWLRPHLNSLGETMRILGYQD